MLSLQQNRHRLNADLPHVEQRRFFSPAAYAGYEMALPLLRQHLRGKCLDVGCGDMQFKDLIANYVTQYDGIDHEARVPHVAYIGDIEDMSMLDDESYDSALCLAVLEHVPHPAQVLAEVARVLRPNGAFVISAPHLSRLHEEPHDYFRYTKYGLSTLLREAGFDVLDIQPYGGLFSFLGHQASTLFLCVFWSLPLLKNLAFFLNKWCCVLPCQVLDRQVDKRRLFALGYTCVARKR